MNCHEIIEVVEHKEVRCELQEARGKHRLKEKDVLIAFEFKINRKILRAYKKKKDRKEKTLLVVEPIENA
jgi:hypothetical protein